MQLSASTELVSDLSFTECSVQCHVADRNTSRSHARAPSEESILSEPTHAGLRGDTTPRVCRLEEQLSIENEKDGRRQCRITQKALTFHAWRETSLIYYLARRTAENLAAAHRSRALQRAFIGWKGAVHVSKIARKANDDLSKSEGIMKDTAKLVSDLKRTNADLSKQLERRIRESVSLHTQLQLLEEDLKREKVKARDALER